MMIGAILGLLLIGGVVIFERDLPADLVDARYGSPASQFLRRADGSRIHYRDEGLADGPVLILMHGSSASLHTWEPWVDLLGDSYRIVTLDLPGHGLTGRVPDDDYSTAASIAVVEDLVQHLGLECFVLGGNSMGGGVSWQFALVHPERVSALLLINTTGLRSWRETRLPPLADSPLAFRLLRQAWFRGVARYVDPQPLIRQGLRAAYYDPERVDAAMVQRYTDLALREGSREATLKRFGALRPGGVEPDLSQLAQPILILWGEHDRLIPPAVGERFASILPDVRLVVYPDAGHIPMEEVAEQSAADVRAFLAANHCE
jgi:pimeloyl-ACP methyl ester carboxylesterase